ncbi:molybdopterin molybdotransferase MoeA [Clostridium sp. DL1XJH146]
MDLFNVVKVEEAKQILNENFVCNLGKETINISKAHGRITSKNVYSSNPVPHFARSTVDGFAVNVKDVYGASESIPSMMDLIGEVHMGKEATSELSLPGECMYVPTGGMLPVGADAVVMIEYTEVLDEKTILIKSPVAPLENVVQVGDDVDEGEILINKGKEIRAYEMGLLSGTGVTDVEVYKKPIIGVISTGDEIISYDKEPKMGEIRDINSLLLTSLAKENLCDVVNYGAVQDDYDLLKNNIEEALTKCDIVLVSGGSSVGKKDQTIRVINSLEDSEILIHGIAIKPGKPTIVGKVKEKIIFGLPGHPMAAAVVFNIFVKHYIDRALEYKKKNLYLQGEFTMNYHKAKGREEFLLVNLTSEGNKIHVEPILTKSGIISKMAKADGYVSIEMNKEGLEEGEKVKVYLL